MWLCRRKGPSCLWFCPSDLKNYCQIQFISEFEFCSRLSSWLGEPISSASFGPLMLRLDEFGVGGITPSHLEEIAAGNSLKDVLKMYMETGNLITVHRRNHC